MPSDADTRLADLVREVRSSPKYAQLSMQLVQNIAAKELQKFGSSAKALKATRARLHQLTGAYLTPKLNYAQWLDNFKALPPGDSAALKATASAMMRLHNSTAERLPTLDTFYATCLKSLGAINSVLDLACGLNPLAIPWMPLTENFTYQAVDVVEPMMAFIAAYFELFGIQGNARVQDLSSWVPTESVQLVLMLKLVPLLDQMDKAIAPRLLEVLNTEHILLSYPLRSLGGHAKGMRLTYTKQFEKLTAGLPYTIQTFEYSNEIAFLLSK